MGRPAKFDADFRCHAVEMVRVSGRPQYQVASDLGVSDTTLAKWMTRERAKDDDTSLTASERAELEQLRAEKRQRRSVNGWRKQKHPMGTAAGMEFSMGVIFPLLRQFSAIV